MDRSGLGMYRLCTKHPLLLSSGGDLEESVTFLMISDSQVIKKNVLLAILKYLLPTEYLL